jgi:transcriptional regulator with XRE-family HTH domain
MRPISVLRVWRKDRGLTMLEIFQATHVAPSQISQIELGKQDPSLRTAYRLHLFTGLPMEDFLRDRAVIEASVTPWMPVSEA